MEHIDALEAVRRLTMERDALANELDAVKDDFRVSHQTLDSIRASTGLCDYGHHLAESLKAMKEDRDALAEQVKRLEVDALQATERHERPETGEEAGEGANGAPRGCNAPSWEKIARDVIWCASLALQNEIRLADARKDWEKLRRLQKGKMALDRIRDELSNIDDPAFVV